MTYFLFFSAIAVGLIFHKSKVCTLYLLAVMCTLAATCYAIADYDNYMNSYSNVLSNSSMYRYIGYSMFEGGFARLNVAWSQYRWIFYIITFSLLVIGVSLLTDKPNLVLSLYMICFYGKDVAQMKSQLSCAIAIIPIAIILHSQAKNKNLSWIQYLLIFLLLIWSATIHLSSAFYLFIALVYIWLLKKKNIKKKIVLISIIAVTAVYAGALTSIIELASKVGILEYTDYFTHLTEKTSRFGFIVSFLWVGLIILSCWSSKKQPMICDKSQFVMSNFALTSLLLLPFLFLSSQYIRLLKVYVIISIACHANNIPSSHKFKISKLQLVNNVAFLGMLGISFYSYNFSFYETTLKAIFRNSPLI